MRPRLLLGLLLLGACHAEGERAHLPDAATAAFDAHEPSMATDAPVSGRDAASVADVPASHSPEVGMEAGPIPDGPADSSAPLGCAASCLGDGVCVVARDGSGRMQATCAPLPPSCRREAGAPDAGTACDQCVGLTVCQGAFGCLGLTTPTYYCGN
jgi:hypothetical protein